jgi:hypothetical protein
MTSAVLIGICTHLGCIDRPPRSPRQLFLPLPRLGLRYLRPHPQRTRTRQPGAAAHEFLSDTKIRIG